MLLEEFLKIYNGNVEGAKIVMKIVPEYVEKINEL